MSKSNGDSASEDREPIRGRFKLTPVEPTGAILGWATNLCDRCLNCDCGVQREPLDLTPGGSMRTFLKLRELQKTGLSGG